MTASDRIPCIRPGCRRTAPADKFEPGVAIVCRKCWKLLPRHVTDAYRQLAKRRRQIERLALKPDRKVQAEGVLRMIGHAQGRNWQSIHDCLRDPEKSAGLDRFLEEMGLA